MKIAKRTTALVLAAGVTMGLALAPMPAAGAQGGDGTHGRASSQALDTLARDVAREESLRAVKDVQRQYAQLAQFGRWRQMAALFAGDGTLQWGATTVTGRAAIAAWLASEAGAMNGVNPGSLNTTIFADPLVNLSADGRTAQARWDGIRFMGDGRGNTRIDGGQYENDYVLDHGQWRIATLHFYKEYEGDYAHGWRNVDGQLLPIVPYHFTPDSAGVPIPAASGPAPNSHESAAQLAARIQALNDEDAVRNLQNAYGYYVDRRMWSDVVDLFARGATVRIAGTGVFHGPTGVRQAMEQTMGPEGLTQSTLNDHPLFDTTVDVLPGGHVAVARGTQLGMLEDGATRQASWQFAVFRNVFVKQDGLWKLQKLDITPLLTAGYADGWGDGGSGPQRHVDVPAFLDISRSAPATHGEHGTRTLADLTRRLARSQAYDGAENVNNAYAEYLTDLNFADIGAIMAQHGVKESPFIGFYLGGPRIAEVGGRYGPPPTLRNFLPIHWNPQPVILVSHDGRSADVRARLFQFGTSVSQASSFYGGMYTNQFVLENGIWRAWDITIDEPYFQSSSWAAGWAGVDPRDPNAPPPPPNPTLKTFPPDLALSDMGEREAGFEGGTGTYVAWPDILPMWFDYRNPVTGRVPTHYQSDCTACGVEPSWSMLHFGYQLPPNGPSIDGVNVIPEGGAPGS